MVFVGSTVDPYQPCEERFNLTRRCLEVLCDCGWPVGVGTRSTLVTRDATLLRKISDKRFCCVFMTITTVDKDLASILEPKSPTPEERLKTVSQLSREGVNVCVAMMPIFPKITDDEESMMSIASSAKKAGAKFFLAGPLMLPLAVKSRLYTLLEKIDPKLIRAYENLYDAQGLPPPNYAEKIQKMAEKTCRKTGLTPSNKIRV